MDSESNQIPYASPHTTLRRRIVVRGASNVHKFYISIDQSQIAKVEAVYYQNGDIILTKTDRDMEYNFLEECYVVNLDQYDTLLFHKVGIPTPVKESLITIQFKFLTKDNDVWVSKPVQDRLYDVIHSEVLR